MSRSSERLRNIAVVAHVDAGKTTCAERILWLARRLEQKGEVHHGDTALDFMPLEREKRLTIRAAATSVPWTPTAGPFAGEAHVVQLVDTPGHADFALEVERALRVVDGAVIVLDAARGVAHEAAAIFRNASRHGVPCIAFLNKLDEPSADVTRCLREVAATLGVVPAPVRLPFATPDGFVLVDLLARAIVSEEDGGRAWRLDPLPAAIRSEVETIRRCLVDVCAGVDEGVQAALATGRDVDAPTLARALRIGTLARRLLVVASGAALRDRGVGPLLDDVVSYLPAPADRPAVMGVDPVRERPVARLPRRDVPLTALAFKSSHEGRAGLVTWLRIYAGTLEAGRTVGVHPRCVRERVDRVFLPDASAREEISSARPGQIVCVTGLTDVRTGETLSALDAPIVLDPIRVPEPLASVALEPETSRDRSKLASALSRLVASDPSLATSFDPSGATVLSGMGPLHLEVAVALLASEHRVRVTARPQS